MRDFGDEPFDGDDDDDWIKDPPRDPTRFELAVREVMAEAEPDEDGIVSISLGEVLDRAIAKMRAAAERSSSSS